MRFDLLDEYSTLVPFGLGVSRNRILQYPNASTKAVKHGAIANRTSRLKMFLKLVGTLCQIGRRDENLQIH